MKTKAVTPKLICVFVFAYAKSRFSHDEAQLSFQLEGQMKDNLAVIKNNCDSLDSRIKTIQNRLGVNYFEK